MSPPKDKVIEPIKASFDEVAKAMVVNDNARAKAPPQSKADSLPQIGDFETAVFENNGDEIALYLDPETQEIWATTDLIAKLYGRKSQTITEHIIDIYQKDELTESATTRNFRVVRFEGGRKVNRDIDHYNLDMILSVGYRVNSKQATEFRKWATRTLKAYLQQGYVINEKALRGSPDKLNKLAAEIRALRSEEKQVYAKVRECFKISASDYDPTARQVKTFYALLQDKFHHAVTTMTSSKLILDRADHTESNMGLQTLKGDHPTLQEAQIGKNYLKPEELYRLHLLSEQFLLYAESTALAGRRMTMESLHQKLDHLVTLNDYPVFEGYQDFLKDEAISHAKMELGLYKKRKKIENLGIAYDEEALAAGEYDELLIEN